MPSLGRKIKEATDTEALGQCLEEFRDLQRVAADETEPAVFFRSASRNKGVAGAAVRLRELMSTELERAGYEVNAVRSSIALSAGMAAGALIVRLNILPRIYFPPLPPPPPPPPLTTLGILSQTRT
jgi:hypothetical protein